MSDLTMISTALSGFQGFRTTMAASLDHAMWFHTSFKADEFMLYECRSTRTSAYTCVNCVWVSVCHCARVPMFLFCQLSTSGVGTLQNIYIYNKITMIIIITKKKKIKRNN